MATAARSTRSTRTPRRRPPAARRRPAGRTLHLLDVENLAGGTWSGPEAVAPALDAYRRSVGVAEADHVVIGSGPTLAVAAKLAWPGSQVVVGRGVDGADRALLRTVDPAFVAARFDRVVIGSGDHAFAGVVSALRARGVAVCVVAAGPSLSRDLRRLTLCLPLASPVAVTRAS
jgi:hypothetical protein